MKVELLFVDYLAMSSVVRSICGGVSTACIFTPKQWKQCCIMSFNMSSEFWLQGYFSSTTGNRTAVVRGRSGVHNFVVCKTTGTAKAFTTDVTFPGLFQCVGESM